MSPMNDEEVRILRAVGERRMHVNKAGRYVIDGGPRPERRARERLLYTFGFIQWPGGDGYSTLTAEGGAALDVLLAAGSR